MKIRNILTGCVIGGTSLLATVGMADLLRWGITSSRKPIQINDAQVSYSRGLILAPRAMVIKEGDRTTSILKDPLGGITLIQEYPSGVTVRYNDKCGGIGARVEIKTPKEDRTLFGLDKPTRLEILTKSGPVEVSLEPIDEVLRQAKETFDKYKAYF